MTYRFTCCLILTLTLTVVASAQGKPGGGGGGGHTGSAPPSSSGLPSVSQPGMNVPSMNTQQQRAFISGKVVLDDGTGITDSAMIQTICAGSRHAVTHTDSHGGFSFEFGDTTPSAAGISDAGIDTTGGPLSNGIGRQMDWRSCEVLAELPGFTSLAHRSEQPPLQPGNHRYRPSGIAPRGPGRGPHHQRHQRHGAQRRAEGLFQGIRKSQQREMGSRPNNCCRKPSRFIPSTRSPGMTWVESSSTIMTRLRRAILSSNRSRPTPSTSIPTAAWPNSRPSSRSGPSWSR